MWLQEASERPAVRSATPSRRPAAPAVRPRDRVVAAAVSAVAAAAIVLFGAVEARVALPLEAVALLAGAAAVVARARRGDRPLPVADVTLPVLCLAALPALQLVPLPAGLASAIAPGVARFAGGGPRPITVDVAATSLALVRWLSYAAYLIAALEATRRPGGAVTALAVVLAVGLFEAVYGTWNLLAGNQSILWIAREAATGDATGSLVNRNHYAAIFELCLPALLARAALDGRPRDDAAGRNVLVGIGAVAMAVGALLSHSRAGTLCLGAAVGVGAALTSRLTATRAPARMALAVAGLGVVCASIVGLAPLLTRFGALSAEPVVRGALWRDAAGAARDFPVAGAGAGAFEAVFPAYRARLGGDQAWAHAHQDPLELAIEGGLAALALATWAAYAFGRRLARRLTGPPATRGAAAWLAAGLAALLAHAQVDFPLHIPGLVYLLLLVAAVVLALPERDPRQLRRSRASAPTRAA
jgi:O-antigen ligase/polysaccharide polymerase Wzy-like membrane protein